ncbi:MAG: 3-deoxy-8-phosphooctulonate synthase, partial [bacterium]
WIRILGKIKDELDIPIITDVHCKTEIDEVAKVVDIIQIPAFLCRQTDLIIKAAKTGLPVNIKKGQFISPQDMRYIVQKIESIEKGKILLTERGTFFGYNNLVVDFRSFPIMREFGYPLIFDATHSSQDRKFVPYLTRAACASGIDGLFMEVHPEPENALCDGQSMVRLDDLEEILNQAKKILAK